MPEVERKTVLVATGAPHTLLLYRASLLEAMVRRGHRVLACAPVPPPGHESRLRALGVGFHEIPLRRAQLSLLGDVQTWMALQRLVRRVHADVVFSYTIKAVIFGSLAAARARIAGVFSMITGLGYAFMAGDWRQRLAGALASPLYRAALRCNRRVFFQNPDDFRLFQERRLIRGREQGTVVPGSGVNLDEFAPAAPVVDRLVFLMAARFLRDKGVVEYVDAARTLKARHPGVTFRLVGSTDANPSAVPAEQVEHWRQEGAVEVLDWVDDLRPQLRQCSVFVLPSYREGLPRGVVEAMAMARPVVTTQAPGCRETVNEGENGFLVPVKDGRSLAVAMERFIAAPQLIPAMGARGRALAESRFDVREVNRILLSSMRL